MGVLVWWVLPVVTTLVGIGWAAWARRAPRTAGDEDTVEAYARFRAALARSSASAPPILGTAPGNRAVPPDV